MSAPARSYRAKLFQTGGSQAVRLPRQCRLPGTEVTVRRVGEAVVIEPIPSGWSADFVDFILSPPEEILVRRQPRRHERERIKL